MITSIPADDIRRYTVNQLNNFFPDGQDVRADDAELIRAFDRAMERAEHCFSHIKVSGYYIIDKNGENRPFFQHTNSDQYCSFLWFFSNTLWEMCPEKKYICDKLILLNKMLHACWYTYKVKLPDIFCLVHPVGSVIGHANYSDYLVINQNVTIGERRMANPQKRIGEYCFLATGSTIMGDGEIGDNVSIGINTVVYKEDIESDSVVFVDKSTGERKIIKTGKPSRAHLYFK